LGIGVDKGQNQCYSPVSDLRSNAWPDNSPEVKTTPPRKQPAVSCRRVSMFFSGESYRERERKDFNKCMILDGKSR
jgi:hypothetical protein